MAKSRIVELAQQIAAGTQHVDDLILEHGVARPTFQPRSTSHESEISEPAIERTKLEVIEATIELRQLLEGPVKLLLPEPNFAPLAAIHRFNIAQEVPLAGAISFADLAMKCGLLEHDLRRIIRFAAVHHRVFQEPKKGYVAHTRASQLLAENRKMSDLMGLTFGECWPAHARAVEAIAMKSEEPNISGYALANETRLTTFEFLELNPLRAQRFADAMSTTSQASLDALSNYFKWKDLPSGSTAVDVGGSKGHVSVHLAQRFPQLNFVVQDLPAVVNGAAAEIPPELRDRVKIESHDMFAEQPVNSAVVYLLRYVLHDWPDKYCLKVLRNLIPALTKGATIVVQDHLLPEPGTLPLLQEMHMRSMDAIMLSLFNSRERDADDWRDLFATADHRFNDISISKIKESPSTCVISVQWNGS